MRINEATPPFSYGCVMLGFESHDVHHLHKAQQVIHEREIEVAGRELETHLTLRYGLENNNLENLYADFRDYFDQIKLKVVGVGVFDTPDGDCVKFEVEPSDELLSMRAMVERNCDCIKDTHPEYHPHITIAFVKKGNGEDCAHRVREFYKFPFEITASHVIVSESSGQQHIIPLRSPQEIAHESIHNLMEMFKIPAMAKIIVPKKTRLSDNAIRKHSKFLEDNGGKYERHADGRHIFRVPAMYAKMFYHKLYNTRGVKEKTDPELSFY